MSLDRRSLAPGASTSRACASHSASACACASASASASTSRNVSSPRALPVPIVMYHICLKAYNASTCLSKQY